jgi:hypothetical protein
VVSTAVEKSMLVFWVAMSYRYKGRHQPFGDPEVLTGFKSEDPNTDTLEAMFVHGNKRQITALLV